MNRKFKVVLIVTALVLACFGVGYAMGCVFGKIVVMVKENKAEKAGYTGRYEVKVDDGVMTPELLLKLGRLSDPQLSPDGKSILYGVSYNSIEKNRSCRNLMLCNADGSEAVQLTRYASSVSNARWSLDGKSIFFLQGGQLYKAPLKGSKLGRKEKLSDVKEGIGEFKLSPDQSQILYTSTIKNNLLQGPRDVDSRLDKAQAYITEDMMYRHWDHWTQTTPRTYVGTLCNGTLTVERSLDLLGTEPYELPTEPFGGIEQLDWAPDGRHIVYSCRKHMGKEYAFSTNCGIYIYDILTGATLSVKTDGGYDTDPVWSPDGSHIAWVSMARDGYEADAQRIMVVDVEYETAQDGQCFGLNCGAPCELASGLDRDKSGLVWTADSREIIFASLDGGVQKLFCVNLEDELRQITADGEKNDFFSPFAIKEGDGSRTLYASNYCLNRPVELIAVSDPKDGPASWTLLTHENDHIFEQLETPASESVWLPTVDGKQMQCWVLYPPQFDPAKQYPAIEIVLGGPQGTNSQDWSYRWCYRLMAQQGYVVIMPNRRGTTAFGQEWKEQISGDYSGLNMQDYMVAGRWMKQQPYVSKLACVGASYGGYSVYMLEGLHGDLYDCFIAHAGIFNEKQMWFTTEEMWFANWDGGGLTEYAYTPGQRGPAGDGKTFGGMQQAGAPYSNTAKALHHYASDPSCNVTKWHTPILCIHGMMDYRIPYEQGMAAFNAAQMMGVPSKLVIFPEENHWILQPQNSLLWHEEFFGWLDRWMK